MNICHDPNIKTLPPSNSDASAAPQSPKQKVKPLAVTELSEDAQRRFWEKVKIAGPNECWLWIGKRSHGYGKFLTHRAHRVSYAIANSSIPDGLNVCHSCDTPLCVNPEHLWAGTQGQNNADRDAKGRSGPQKRTHCINGHILTGDHIYMGNGGRKRVCRLCRRDRDRLRREAKRNNIKIL